MNSCLVVDDHLMIRETIALMLKSLGIETIYTACNGAEAISKIFHKTPSFIITDLQMEPIDGLEMLRLIRSGRYGLKHDIPIIVLTANASEQIIAECIVFDVDAFIVKPVKKDLMQARIEQLTNRLKIKKNSEHYFSIYKKDPTKITNFLINDNIEINKDELNSIDSLTIKNKDSKTTDKSTPVKINNKVYIKWQERFSVNNDILDKSNKKLLNIINETFYLISENSGTNKDYENLAKRFREYIHDHHIVENKLLQINKYDQVLQHKQIHKKLSEKAEYILLKCQAEPKFYKTNFFNLLKYWWIEHIIKEDSKYKNKFIGR